MFTQPTINVNEHRSVGCYGYQHSEHSLRALPSSLPWRQSCVMSHYPNRNTKHTSNESNNQSRSKLTLEKKKAPSDYHVSTKRTNLRSQTQKGNPKGEEATYRVTSWLFLRGQVNLVCNRTCCYCLGSRYYRSSWRWDERRNAHNWRKTGDARCVSLVRGVTYTAGWL